MRDYLFSKLTVLGAIQGLLCLARVVSSMARRALVVRVPVSSRASRRRLSHQHGKRRHDSDWKRP